ncbi:helix-turn-helix domain-containing protein [Nonomuraea sp. NPDC046802]|uniref:TetR/AcrR family transcriptional regulator n=1 Tax=Nonomuraea sp. NPDC046802 TaxID=3154919 RepID=UPI0033F590C1
MIRRSALREHAAAGILDIAATVFAEHGEAASMTDIAKAAGVGRATLYRYFPSREALVQALYQTAVSDLFGKIDDANLDAVPVEEALARLTRAAMTMIGKYRALAVLDSRMDGLDEVNGRLAPPFQQIFERGAADETFRTDLSTSTLMGAYVGLLRGIGNLVIQGHMGVEEASAAVMAAFLDGARYGPKPTTPNQG